jgi:branched-chain amino acid aminotransferase
MTAEKVYLNGELIDHDKAVIPVGNPGLLHGVGLFETLRVYSARPFRLDRHIERMQASAAKLDLSIGNAQERIPDAVKAVVETNQLTDARVRFTITPPADPSDAESGTLLVTAQAVAGYPPELYEQGMTVYICDTYRQSSRDPLAGHKTTSYLPRLLALRTAQEKHCGEALWFTPTNHLAEGSISNVFLVKDGCLRTPALDTPVLPGITRAEVLDLARSAGIRIEESPCSLDDVLDADEVFLTNAVMEVMPVTRIERIAIAGEKPGPITRQLHDAYRERTLSVR